MTKYFEVVKRDGPARLGRLLLENTISTPSLLSHDDYISLGSIFSYGSIDQAIRASKSLKGLKKLAVMPYVASSIHTEPVIRLPKTEIIGPKGIVIHPFSEDELEKADVYIISSAGSLRRAKDLTSAVLNAKYKIASDTALYAPALATPANLAFLIYLGIDLVDSVRIEADAYLGRFHSRDGVFNLDDLEDLPCKCKFCLEISEHRDSDDNRRLLAGHNIFKLEEELSVIRQMMKAETIREYVERQVRVTPELTASLRLLDKEYRYLEARTPQYRKSIFYANTAESLKRAEVKRFADRVLNRYRAPMSDVLLLLPCSARKPYSTSRSHRLFAEAIRPWKRYLHELILTSPLALVPRELEEVYPAASYDVPVTGHWDLEERAWLLSCLDTFLEKKGHYKIVAHIEGELREIVEHHGIDAIYTDGGSGSIGLARLSEAVRVACQGAPRLEDLRLQRFSAVADYYFGSRGSDALLDGKVKVRGREIQDDTGKALAMMTANGTLALSLEGARRMETAGSYIIDIGDFVPKGSLLAPGVMDADEQIRPGDEVIIRGGMAFGMGRARMSGWEMIRSSRGVAADIRQMEAL